jgi:hypothetical protein
MPCSISFAKISSGGDERSETVRRRASAKSARPLAGLGDRQPPTHEKTAPVSRRGFVVSQKGSALVARIEIVGSAHFVEQLGNLEIGSRFGFRRQLLD